MTFPQNTPVNLPGRGGNLLATDSANISGDATTTTIAPVYATLFTASITSTEPSTKLGIYFYASWLQNGGAVGLNVAANFRFLLNGALIGASRGATSNQITGRIETTTFVRELTGLAPGVQLVTCEWTRFGGVGVTLRISAAALPDLQGSAMVIQSIRG